MENKNRNIIFSYIITGIVVLMSLTLVYLFFVIIKAAPAPEQTSGQIKINKELYDKITSSNTENIPLVLENEDFGRQNPFDEIK